MMARYKKSIQISNQPDVYRNPAEFEQRLIALTAGTTAKQIDGDHYTKMCLQPWEIIEKNGLDYWEGNALKYLLRWRQKDGIIDLDKVIHYCEQIKALALKGHYGEQFKDGGGI